jgi:putative addiction module CopG family antidote
MNITLSPDIEAVVGRLVESGRYASETDALAAAVRLLEEEEGALAEVRRQIEAGALAADRGELHTLDAVAAILRRDHEDDFGPQDWGG